MSGTAVVDWLSFTFTAWREMPESIPDMVRAWLHSWLGVPILGESGNGLYGFQHSVTFSAYNFGETTNIAVLAWGGDRQKGRIYLSINGSGCSMVKDWECLYGVLSNIPESRITRVDLAVDALNGEFTVETARDWYRAGEFNAGGRSPKYKMEGDWDIDLGLGRTFYVGKRENGKYTRCYEKGKQLGLPTSPWTRFEVELHNTDRTIPLDVVKNPSSYFAGCYPCCESLVDVGAERIKTTRAEMEISLSRLKTYCRVAYGKLLNVIRITHDDPAAILSELTVQGVPRRLEKITLTAFSTGADGPPLSEVVNHAIRI